MVEITVLLPRLLVVLAGVGQVQVLVVQVQLRKGLREAMRLLRKVRVVVALAKLEVLMGLGMVVMV